MLHWRLGQGFILYIYLNILMAVQTKRVVPVLSLSTDRSHSRASIEEREATELFLCYCAWSHQELRHHHARWMVHWKMNQKYLVRTWEQDMLIWREQQFWILIDRDIPVEVETCEIWVLWNLNFYPCFFGCLLNDKCGYYLKDNQRCPAQVITINLV